MTFIGDCFLSPADKAKPILYSLGFKDKTLTGLKSALNHLVSREKIKPHPHNRLTLKSVYFYIQWHEIQHCK